MSAWWPIVVLIGIVTVLLVAHRQPSLQSLFKWCPLPLWCYAIPLVAVTVGWLPSGHPAYRWLTDHILPLALSILLLGVDVPAVLRSGAQALLAMIAGALAIIVGAPLAVWVLRASLPLEAWKGAGSLAATWTGGTMNLLALRAALATPNAMFAPLIIVDAVVAYSWMALLVAISAYQSPINRWLRVSDDVRGSASPVNVIEKRRRGVPGISLLIAFALVVAARTLAAQLPTMLLISSSTGWTVLLVTTGALGLSLIPRVRSSGERANELGYACLYLVLAATGAQASFTALWSAPVWLAVGFLTVFVHGVVLLLVGRAARIPLGTLATASQANIGGVVSAPLVGAVYRQDLVPIGLLLAVAGNALGTYLGLLAAWLSRCWLGQG